MKALESLCKADTTATCGRDINIVTQSNPNQPSFIMQIKLNSTLLCCVLVTITGAEVKQRKQQHKAIVEVVSRGIKEKRDAYQGLSYKYLPVGLTALNYDSYGGDHSAGLSNAGSYAIGNGLNSGLNVYSHSNYADKYPNTLAFPLHGSSGHYAGHTNGMADGYQLTKILPQSSFAGFNLNGGHNSERVLSSHYLPIAGLNSNFGQNKLNNYKYEITKPLHVMPHTSYSVPLALVGSSYSPKYHTHTIRNEPSYAIGHKGLRHFGSAPKTFQFLNTRVTDSSHKKVNNLFKPSTFFGTKYESNGILHSGGDDSSDHLLKASYNEPSKGYDYSANAGYEESQFQVEDMMSLGGKYASSSSYNQPSTAEASVGDNFSHLSENY